MCFPGLSTKGTSTGLPVSQSTACSVMPSWVTSRPSTTAMYSWPFLMRRVQHLLPLITRQSRPPPDTSTVFPGVSAGSAGAPSGSDRSAPGTRMHMRVFFSQRLFRYSARADQVMAAA